MTGGQAGRGDEDREESRTSIRQFGPCARASRASSVSSVASNASASAT
ncbi:hypothetical protein I547_6036 [Mycobacterium kansasii 824]|nr:hypothetical protein I547_6036 [Mycobacterium kansasii 824]